MFHKKMRTSSGRKMFSRVYDKSVWIGLVNLFDTVVGVQIWQHIGYRKQCEVIAISRSEAFREHRAFIQHPLFDGQVLTLDSLSANSYPITGAWFQSYDLHSWISNKLFVNFLRVGSWKIKLAFILHDGSKRSTCWRITIGSQDEECTAFFEKVKCFAHKLSLQVADLSLIIIAYNLVTFKGKRKRPQIWSKKLLVY